MTWVLRNPIYAPASCGIGTIVPVPQPLESAPGEAALVEKRSGLTIPTVVTLLGYVAGLAWLAGGPGYLALLSLAADELDGRLARAIKQTSAYGKEIDYAVDLTLTGLSALRMFGRPGLLTLPLITATQAYIRSQDKRPTFGSARAALMLGALFTGR